MARPQSDELEKTKRELPVSTGQFPQTSAFERATPKGLRTRESIEAGPEARPPLARLPKLAFA